MLDGEPRNIERQIEADDRSAKVIGAIKQNAFDELVGWGA
jgi:hypothetical protein